MYNHNLGAFLAQSSLASHDSSKVFMVEETSFTKHIEQS